MNKALSGKTLVLQIGETEIRAACLRLGGKAPQILDRAVIPTPEGAVVDGAIQDLDAVRDAINALRETQPVLKKARKVIFVLCSTQVIAQNVCVPQMKSEKKLEQMLLANADMYFPVDTSDYQLTWGIVGEKEADGVTQTQLQMWATPKNLLNFYYLLANSCGLTVAAVDYCAHSYAAGIGAAFAAPKPSRQKKQRKKNAEVEGEYQPQPAKEAADLYIDFSKDHLTMSFVQQGQVLLQRIHLRSDYIDTDLNEIFMEIEYFHSMFPDKASGACIVSGSDAEDWELLRGLEEVVGVPLQKLEQEEGQEWCMCIGAGQTRLDFGDATMNSRPAQKMRSSLGSPWQYVLVAVGGVLLVLSVMNHVANAPLWETELQSLRDMELMLKMQTVGGNTDGAQQYNDYAAAYDAYSSDWDTIFKSVRTYNDNARLILEELEGIFPEDAVLSALAMNEDSLNLEVAFQEKADVAYFLVALRKMQYADLLGVSDLLDIRQPEIPDMGTDTDLSAALAGGDYTDMLNAYLASGYEFPPKTGSGYEAPPKEGGSMDAVMDAAEGKVDKQTVISMATDEDFLGALSEEQRDFLVSMVVGQMTGEVDPNNLSSEQQGMMLEIALVYAGVAKDKYGSGDSTNPDSSTTEDESFKIDEMLQNRDFIDSLTQEEMQLMAGLVTGQQSAGSLSTADKTVLVGVMQKYQDAGGSANSGSSVIVSKPKRDTDTSKIHTADMQATLAEANMTRQDLIDGLDNLEYMAETHTLDHWYLYEPYGGRELKDLLNEERRTIETKAAIRNLLSSDPLALQQFFMLMQEDLVRPSKEQILIPYIVAEYFLNPYYSTMIKNSDQAMLDRYLPGFIDMLTRSADTIKATENLILQEPSISAKLAGHLVTELGLRDEFNSGINFDQMTLDIITGYTKTDAELDGVVQKMLRGNNKAIAYYKMIPAAKGETLEYANADADLLAILMGLMGDGSLGGMEGLLGSEPLGDYQISVVLGYKDTLIEAEQIRKGLDVNAKVGKVEVTE